MKEIDANTRARQLREVVNASLAAGEGSTLVNGEALLALEEVAADQGYSAREIWRELGRHGITRDQAQLPGWTGEPGPPGPVIYVGGPDDIGDGDGDGLVEDGTMTLFESEYLVCKTCGVPLNKLTDNKLSEVTYIHTQTWNRYDHDPIPVAGVRNINDNAVCDFCGVSTRMHWMFQGERLRIDDTEGTTHDYGVNWTACATCGPLILSGDIRKLHEHAKRVSPSCQGRSAEERNFISQTWLPLWEAFIPTIKGRRYIGPRIECTNLHPRNMVKYQQGLVKFWQDPVMGQIHAKGRRDVVDTYNVPAMHAGIDDDFRAYFPASQGIPPEVWDNHTQHLITGIRASELYWISAEFTQLATMAGHDFEKIVISREQLPAPHGFMVFQEPIGELPRDNGNCAYFRAVSWTLVPGGIWLNLYIQSEDGLTPYDTPANIREKIGYFLSASPGVGLQFDTDMEIPPPGEGDFYLTVLATWFLIQQPGVADQRVTPPDKKLARSYQRAHQRPMSPVTLVDLRKQPRRTAEDREKHEGRQLTKRVYRRGHWKRQFYGPGRALRKTIYVSGYIAGPEGAPLHESPRVVKVLR